MDSSIKYITREDKLKDGLKWKKLVIKNHIKSGAFGDVYKYCNSKCKSQVFAVKILKPQDDDIKEKVKIELSLLEELSDLKNASDFFPVYYGHVSYFPENKPDKVYYALVFELGHGNLRTLVDSRNVGLSFEENMSLLKCFAQGLSYLQLEKVSHRDLKPDNIIFFENEEKTISFKIIDFGEAKINVDDGTSTLKGTPLYFAPEVNISYLNSESHINKKNYNPFKSDIYSVGLLFLYANLMALPFPTAKQRIVEKECNPFENKKGPFDDKIKEMIGEIEDKFSHCRGIGVFSAILKKCLQYNPGNRIDFIELKQVFHYLKAEMSFNDSDEENKISKLKSSKKSLKTQLDTMTNEMLKWKKKCEKLEENKINLQNEKTATISFNNKTNSSKKTDKTMDPNEEKKVDENEDIYKVVYLF